MPSKNPEIRRAARARFRAKYPEKIREQKRRARERKALLNPKPIRTHCANGHPENRDAKGTCRDCRNATKRRQADKRRASQPPKEPRVPALTQAEKRAADPSGQRKPLVLCGYK